MIILATENVATHHQGRPDVGEHVAADHVPIAGAERARRLHEAALLDGEGLAADDPRVGDPSDSVRARR